VHRNCLTEEVLTSYLEDSLQTTARAVAEEHLVSCDGCRNRLVYYMRILDEDIREEEEPVLELAMRRWDPEAVPPPPAMLDERAPAPGIATGLKLALVASVVVAALLGAVAGFRNPAVPSSEEVLERVLRERRTFRPRTSLQEAAEDYVAYVETRDGASGGGDQARRLDPLLAAASEEGAGSHILGLHYLVTGDYDRAVTYLEEAVLESEVDPGVENDLGVAYYVRPKTSGISRTEDDDLARLHFQSAIELDSDYLPAQFNLVLLNRRAGFEAEVRVAAERYFAKDSDSGWAAELQDLVGSGEF